MSYSLYLYRKGIEDKGIKCYYDYKGNITFNAKAILEEALGREHFKRWTRLPADLWIGYLEKGINRMKAEPARFKAFDFSNGDGEGTYDRTLALLEKLFLTVQRFGYADGLRNIYLEVWY